MEALSRAGRATDAPLPLHEVPAGPAAHIHLSAHGPVLRPGDGLTPDAIWSLLRGGLVGLHRVPGGEGPAYVLQHRPAAQQVRRALSATESRVLELSAEGVLGKQQALELGLAPSSVSRLLSRAVSKLGAGSAFEAIVVVAGLLGRRVPAGAYRLTASELEVLALLRHGLSNGQIARQRGRSVRTIANQVASLLRKTGMNGRRALGTLCDEPAGRCRIG